MNRELNIRAFHPSDIPHIMEICLRTSDNGRDGGAEFRDPYMVGQIYALPYLIHSSGICFSACINQEPKGYILGTENSREFYSWMEDEFLPPLRERYPEDMDAPSESEKHILSRIHSDRKSVEFDRKFPAHLHIDLLPQIQGMGAGKELINRYLQELSSRNIPGCYLVVSEENTRALQFYLHIGFEEHSRMPGAVKMVRKL